MLFHSHQFLTVTGSWTRRAFGEFLPIFLSRLHIALCSPYQTSQPCLWTTRNDSGKKWNEEEIPHEMKIDE